VLDYKSAARPESQPQLQAQLRQYRAAVRAMVRGEAVFAAFLTGDGRMVVVDDVAQGELF
jgi:ATP-dependent helicase/nuclease subunit A